MSSIFTKIIRGEIPCHKIAESEHCLAFLDINPVQRGHVLVIPKKEVDYFYDLEDETLTRLMLFSKKVAKAIEKVVPCNRISVVVAGLEVPHAHIHLIPMNAISDIDFSEKLSFSSEEMKTLAAAISRKINE